MPQPRPEDGKIVRFPAHPRRRDAGGRADDTNAGLGLVLPFTGVRFERFADDASFAAALAALASAKPGRMRTRSPS